MNLKELLKVLNLEDEKQSIVKDFIEKLETDYKGKEEALQKTLDEQNKQIEALNANVGTIEDFKKQVETLQAENKKSQEEFENKLKLEKMESAINYSLKGLAKDTDVVKKFIEYDKLSVGTDGQIVGVDEQIKGLKEKYGYLFNVDNGSLGSNYTPKGGSNKPVNNPFSKEHFNLTKQMEILSENPARAKELANLAGVEI